MKHSAKLNAPRVAVFGIVIIDQDRDAAIDIFGEFGILLRAENRTGTGIGIDKSNIVPA